MPPHWIGSIRSCLSDTGSEGFSSVHRVQDEPLLHGDGMRLISVVLPSEFAVDVGVCVVLLDLGFVAIIFCRVLRELKNIVVVARWLFIITRGGRLNAIRWGQWGDVGCLLCCWWDYNRVCESHNFYENHHISKNTWLAIHVNLRFSNNISPNLLAWAIFCRIIKSYVTDRQTDKLIWGGLGNLRFLQV